MSQELIQYFEQVLGIREFIATPLQSSSEPVNQVENTLPRLVLFVDQKPWTASASDLFEKMKLAMKLENVETQTVFTDQMSAADFQLLTLKAHTVISFCEELSKSIQNENLFMTVSPQKLLESPELKKQAWADLQNVMRFLAQSPVSN